MKTIFSTLCMLICFQILAFADNDLFDETKLILKRSVLSRGNVTRIKQVMAKAARGEDIVFGVIGGSITHGHSANEIKNRWANRVYRWMVDSFPSARINFINSGISGTGSDYGAHRVYRDLLKYQPDFVIVEFAVNDRNTKSAAETLEGMTRQILKSHNSPALLFLFFVYKDGHSAQEYHSRVGAHYDLPMISYGNAIFPEIQSGSIKWSDLSNDLVHPNSRGHKLCAELIITFLDGVHREMNDASVFEVHDIPSPLISNMFEHTAVYGNRDIVPIKNQGWTDYKGGWKTEIPGSTFEFDIQGQIFSILFSRANENMGIAEVVINNNEPIRLSGWFSGSWIKKQFQMIGNNAETGRSRLKIKLLGDSVKEGRGHLFEIQSIMAAGIK